ncbi:uncharacterized protein BYT42DRAFT_493953, partial [Radiomyces spectabilis]|uniref:uncharacterized protein n=1 Tax=Radiomyces spectabilis TaxID=64574 RepID=UPI00221FAF0A
LKLKASLCRRLSDWDCDKDFQNTYQTMADHDYQLAYLFLPYLSNIATRCSQLSTWLPNRTIEVLKTQTRTPVKFVNMLRLLLRTTDFSTSLRSLIIPLLHDFGEWNASTKVFQTNCWQLYLISIEAGICGWYQVMHSILRDLSKSVRGQEVKKKQDKNF